MTGPDRSRRLVRTTADRIRRPTFPDPNLESAETETQNVGHVDVMDARLTNVENDLRPIKDALIGRALADG